MAQLNADADFQELPVCTACLRPYPPDSSGTAVCASCGSALYDTQPTTIQQRSGRTSRTRPKPFLQCPYKSLEEQLCELIPEIENLVDGWRAKPRTSGKYGDHFDGEVCKNLEGPDGSPFFRPDLSELPDGELRIGVTLGVDWFSYRRSLISASHSSCPMSFSIINLPPSLRYRAANLILTAIMPGPQEQSADEVQHFLHVIVDDLLRLWKDGIKISTPRFPDGRVVRVALVGIVCDKPAAHKLAGYGSHSHRHFCTLCWAEQKKKEPFTTRIFEENGYPRRTNQQHREHQERYRACKTDGAREAFVKEHAARWSELSRLPYFNFEKMVIIDPMHNLFLGLVKNHFYHIWVKSKVLRKTKELNHLHAILNKMKMPSKVGRLPQLIGEPAGGSLTADQWLLLATLIGPLAIPQIWQDYAAADPAATLAARKIAITAAVHERRAAAAAKRKTAKQKKAQRTAAARQRDPAAAPAAAPIRRSQRTRTQTRKAQGIDAASGSEAEESGDEWVDDGALEDSEDETFDDEGSRRKRPRRNGDTDDPRRPSQLVPDDVTNFLKLCEALQLLLLSEITEEQVVRAEKLIREYGIGLIELYGADVLKPNHHYATHIGEFVRNMGPLHCFWTFLFERMNKILKSYKTNNHGGGEIEVTFFREFHRTIRTSRMLANGARASSETGLPRAVEAMSKTSEDDRGTVQALAQELDEQYEHAGIKLRMSTRYETANPSPELYSALLRFFQTCVPDIRYRSWIAAGDDESYPLMPSAIFFDHVVINQRRYTSLLRSNASAEALVVVRINDAGSTWVGELLEIFSTTQIPLGTRVFGYMRWFVPFEKDITLTPWRECARLGVRLWQHGIYLTPDDNGPSPIIDLEHIIGHAVRADITVGEAEAWATNVVRPVGALIPYPL
ncbi:hypothetical protein PsYK624_167230 [Phanerochaete sordida]|uniref:Transposase domain-containing protein n=1 Tax=Phanerochaete sordida TaxID=48140 RepID=A0A9P3LNF6_9APHY|nr:hypothetical protein PsYK624_167230 [Phanerochaete sordida]